MNNIRSIKAQLPQEGASPQWFAFRTMYKREKMVERRLNALGLEPYVPLRVSVKHYKSKTVTAKVPLFSSYVFVRIHASDYSTVLSDPDVFELVCFQGEVGRVTEEEIEFLRAVLRDGGDSHDVEFAETFVPGAEVVIAGGTLAGTKGKILKTNGAHNFLVALKSVGLSLKIMVRDEHLALDSTAGASIRLPEH